MRRALVVLLAPLLLPFLSPARALAQRPVLTLVPVNTALTRLNIEDYEDTSEKVDFIWNVVGGGVSLNNYEYEVTYDSISTELRPATQVCVDETFPANDPQGRAQAMGRLRMTKAQIMNVMSCTDPDGPMPVLDRQDRSIVVRVYLSTNEFDQNSYTQQEWKFLVDTKRPPAPVLERLVAGENQVRVTWSAPSSDIDVDTYQVLYCRNVSTSSVSTATVATSSVATSTVTLPCAEPTVIDEIAKTQFDYSIEDDIRVGETIAVAVRAVDEAENIGPISAVQTATPIEVNDFFELYKKGDGAEDGGFCFVATAAYGSYAHPAVRVLRAFRDVVLKHVPFGHLAISTYYALSPPLAEAVRADPTLRGHVRLALVPVTMAAVLVLASPLLAAVALVAALRRRRRVRALGVAALLAVLWATPARAQSRPTSKFETVGLGFEAKGGPYRPKSVEAASGPDRAFTTIFGKDGEAPGARPLYTLGLDLQLLRGFGSVGIGGSFAFMQYVGKAQMPDGSRSSDTTVFNLLPLTLTAVYRFDVLADRANIPLVPYARGGLAYHIWWVTDGRGDISKWDGPNGQVSGRGGKLGFTGTVGISFLLNFIEPRAARNLYEGTSVRGTYVFAEYQINKVDGFGADGFDFSDNTWNVGLFVEL